MSMVEHSHILNVSHLSHQTWVSGKVTSCSPRVTRVSGDDGRCMTPVGNTVDMEAANWTNTIGASELAMVWSDPDFDPDQKAFYYGRVIEIPTPRWVLYDRLRFGTEIPEDAELIHQERAYTSPIWYKP